MKGINMLRADGVWSEITAGTTTTEEMTDVDILQYALTLEHLESAMYKAMLATNLLTGKVMEALQTFGDHEAAHVDALTKALQAAGAEPVNALPEYHFPALDSREAILNFAKMAEDIGVSAYQGVAAQIDNKDYLVAAASIMQVEARHAAIISVLLGLKPAPNAVTASLKAEDVVKKVNPILGM